MAKTGKGTRTASLRVFYRNLGINQKHPTGVGALGNLTQTGRVRTFLLLAPREGLEPSTYWLTASRSNQLSYLGIFNC